jgi:hypothetical protein
VRSFDCLHILNNDEHDQSIITLTKWCAIRLNWLFEELTVEKPPRSQPKIHQLQVKSHKLTIMITVPPSTTIAQIKEEAFSALVSDVNQVEDVPKVSSDDDFEICREVKDKGKSTGQFEPLDVTKQVREYSMASWDTLYLQFKDPSGKHYLPLAFFVRRFIICCKFAECDSFNINSLLYWAYRQLAPHHLFATQH